LTPVGYLQFETGTLSAVESTEFDARLGINEVVKLTVAPRLEVILQTEPFVHSRLGTDTENHPGDVAAPDLLAGFRVARVEPGFPPAKTKIDYNCLTGRP
jgi:hypothetical protein